MVFDDLADEELADLEELGFFNKATTHDGIGTWRTAGDSLWIEIDEVITYEGDTEVKWSEIPTTDVYELGDGGPMSEEQRADLEALFPSPFKLWVEFTGTYQIAGDSLLLTSLGLDGVDRTRTYTRTNRCYRRDRYQLGGAEGPIGKQLIPDVTHLRRSDRCRGVPCGRPSDTATRTRVAPTMRNIS